MQGRYHVATEETGSEKSKDFPKVAQDKNTRTPGSSCKLILFDWVPLSMDWMLYRSKIYMLKL